MHFFVQSNQFNRRSAPFVPSTRGANQRQYCLWCHKINQGEVKFHLVNSRLREKVVEIRIKPLQMAEASKIPDDERVFHSCGLFVQSENRLEPYT